MSLDSPHSTDLDLPSLALQLYNLVSTPFWVMELQDTRLDDYFLFFYIYMFARRFVMTDINP